MIANIHHAYMEVLTVVNVVARNADDFGGVYIWWESGVRWSVCVGIFSRNLAPVAVVMFLHSVYFIKKFG